jgi:hypothetical protein
VKLSFAAFLENDSRSGNGCPNIASFGWADGSIANYV